MLTAVRKHSNVHITRLSSSLYTNLLHVDVGLRNLILVMFVIFFIPLLLIPFGYVGRCLICKMVSAAVRTATSAQQQTYFATPANFSYTCRSRQEVPLAEHGVNTSAIESVTMSVWGVRIQALIDASNKEPGSSLHGSFSFLLNIQHN